MTSRTANVLDAVSARIRGRFMNYSRLIGQRNLIVIRDTIKGQLT